MPEQPGKYEQPTGSNRRSRPGQKDATEALRAEGQGLERLIEKTKQELEEGTGRLSQLRDLEKLSADLTATQREIARRRARLESSADDASDARSGQRLWSRLRARRPSQAVRGLATVAATGGIGGAADLYLSPKYGINLQFLPIVTSVGGLYYALVQARYVDDRHKRNVGLAKEVAKKDGKLDIDLKNERIKRGE